MPLELSIPETLTDSELLDAFLEGDEAAFELLVRRHERMVYNLCFRITCDEQLAENAMQAVFLTLCRKAITLRARNNIAIWLYKVAWNIARRERSSESFRKRRERRVSVLKPGFVQRNDERSELSDQLDEELRALPEKFLMPLLMYYFNGVTEEEGARTLGLSVGTFSSRISRARHLLRERLSRKGVAPAVLVSGLLVTCAAKTAEVPASVSVAAGKIIQAGIAGRPVALVSAHVQQLSDETIRALFRVQAAKWTAAAAVLLVAVLFSVFGGRAAPSVPAASPVPAVIAPPVLSGVAEKLNQKIDFEARSYMPEEVLIELQRRTGIAFARPRLPFVDHSFSFAQKDVSVRDVLGAFCRENKLVMAIQNDTVIISKKLDDEDFNRLAQAAKMDEPLGRAQAAVDLAQSGDIRAIPLLADLLAERDELVQFWAAFALERYSGSLLGQSDVSQRTAATVLGLLKDPPSALNRRLLLSLLIKTHSADAFPSISERLSGSADERIVLADVLTGQQHPLAVKVLTKLLSDTETRVRSAAAKALSREIRLDSAVPALLGALNDEDDTVRANALYALSKSSDAGAVLPAARARLLDRTASVRAQAAIALGNLEDSASVEALTSVLNDAAWSVRIAAARSLAIINKSDNAALFMKAMSEVNSTYVWQPARETFEDGAEGRIQMWRYKPVLEPLAATLEPHPSLMRKLADTMLAELSRTKNSDDLDPRLYPV